MFGTNLYCTWMSDMVRPTWSDRHGQGLLLVRGRIIMEEVHHSPNNLSSQQDLSDFRSYDRESCNQLEVLGKIRNGIFEHIQK